MAQLRDSVSSELVAEGDPEELVLIAEGLPADSVIYDGVGESFDPQAVLDARQKRIDGLNANLSDPEASDELKKHSEDALKQDEAKIPDTAQVQEVQANVEEARSKVKPEHA